MRDPRRDGNQIGKLVYQLARSWDHRHFGDESFDGLTRIVRHVRRTPPHQARPNREPPVLKIPCHTRLRETISFAVVRACQKSKLAKTRVNKNSLGFSSAPRGLSACRNRTIIPYATASSRRASSSALELWPRPTSIVTEPTFQRKTPGEGTGEGRKRDGGAPHPMSWERNAGTWDVETR